jgi:hypothetical protein
MNNKILAVVGVCAALLLVCVICIGVMVAMNVPGMLEKAVTSALRTQPEVQGRATLAPSSRTPAAQPAPTSAASATQATGIPSSGRTKGNPNAPIAFVDYSDFQ